MTGLRTQGSLFGASYSRLFASCFALVLGWSCSAQPKQGPDEDDAEEEEEDSEDEESEDENQSEQEEDNEASSDSSDEEGEGEENDGDEKGDDDTQKPQEPGDRALVIKHGWDIPGAHALHKIEKDIKDSPFDGVVFSAGKSSRIFGPDEVSLQQMKRDLQGLREIKDPANAHYYLVLYVDQIPGGFTGDGAKTLINNAERLGKILSDLPVKGLAFDNEVYKKSPWDLPQACPGLDRKACGKVAFETGHKMMAALMKSWPDLHFWAFFGPWLNDHRTYDWINEYSIQNDWAEDDDIASEFVAGAFAASTEGPALFIDGGEFYGLRTRKHFAKTAIWMRTEMVKESPFFPEKYKHPYAKQMKVGFGIYDDRIHLYSKMPRLNERRWSDVIHAATKEADFVWVYTERHDWWKNDGNDWPDTSKKGTAGPVTSSWEHAARGAIVGKPRLLRK